MFREIFGNASFTGEIYFCSDDSCDDTYKPLVAIGQKGERDIGNYHFHPMKLTFVSCGDPYKKALAFDQLVAIFDCYTWVFIVIMITAGTVFSSTAYLQYYNQRNSSKFEVFTKNLLFQVKPLLDQGDPINMPLLKIPGFRASSIAFLFVALIISNAYRYDNITKLTLPRQPIPFDTFSSLVNSGFSIYTRGTIVGGFTSTFVKRLTALDEMFTEFITEYNNQDTKNIGVYFRSEVYYYVQWEISVMANMEDKELKNISIYYINQTVLHPQWMDLLFDTNGNCSVFTTKSTDCDVLRFCNKTAVLLPHTIAHEKFHEMRGNAYENVFIAKKTLIEYKHVIM